MSPLLREIIREALVQSPTSRSSRSTKAVDLRDAVERDDAGLRDRRRGRAATRASGRSSRRRARLRALEVRRTGRESVLYELRPHRVSLGEISSETLVRTIRAAPAWDGGAVSDETSQRRTV
jgi:hypothetical protein